MAQRGQDILGRLADAGEEAIQKLAEAPGADRLLGVANSMRERIDELQRRTRNIGDLERRLEVLERRLDKLAPEKDPRSAPGTRSGASSSAKGPAAKRSTAKRSTAKRSSGKTRRSGGSGSR